jgi:hypothetical protein
MADALHRARALLRRLHLHTRRLYLQTLIHAAQYDERRALRAAASARPYEAACWASYAAGHRCVQQVLRVELARVVGALRPVRGAA